jgi:hypothetical protein
MAQHPTIKYFKALVSWRILDNRREITLSTSTPLFSSASTSHSQHIYFFWLSPFFYAFSAFLTVCALGLAILTRPDNPIRTRHEISGFGSTLNGSTRLSWFGGSGRGWPARHDYLLLFFFSYFFFGLKKKKRENGLMGNC